MVAHLRIPQGVFGPLGRAFRITMVWQAAASVVLASVAGLVAGFHGFLSAMVGGGIGLVGVLVFALVSRRRAGSSSTVVRIALRAEAAKILVIFVLLWLAFVTYRDMVVLPFLGAFIISVLLSGLAFVVSSDQLNSSRV
jgi:F0F1-type ATP synthase assembly protein I